MARWVSMLAVFGILGVCAGIASADADPLYAGTNWPGVVYQYAGGTTWEAISPPLGDSVRRLAYYEGDLYAAVASTASRYDYTGGRVYRHDGGGAWTVVGEWPQVADTFDQYVTDLLVYREYLYAGTADEYPMLCRFEGGTEWAEVLPGDIPFWGVGALWVGGYGYLHISDRAGVYIGHYQGPGGLAYQDYPTGRHISDFSEFGWMLYGGGGLGHLCKSEGRWCYFQEVPLPGEGDWELWELEQFDNHLYLGDEGGLLRRINGLDELAVVWSGPSTDSGRTSIIAMLAYGHDCIYLGTGLDGIEGQYGEPVGRVYRYDGSGPPELISGQLGEGVQCLFALHLFPDVRCEHWAYEEIEGCNQAGVVAGYTDGHFYPIWDITRDQMAVFLSRATLGGEQNVPSGPAQASYPDVGTDHWAYRHIEWCAQEAIVQGYPDGGYHPDDELTRDQMAVFIARALTGGIGCVPDDPCTTPPFPDIPCDFWARPHIEYILAANVARGFADGLYRPEIVCTRDQMCVFVGRAYNLFD